MGNIQSRKKCKARFFECDKQLEFSNEIKSVLNSTTPAMPSNLIDIIDDYLYIDNSRQYAADTFGIPIDVVNQFTDHEITTLLESTYIQQQILSKNVDTNYQSIKTLLTNQLHSSIPSFSF